MSKYEDKVEHLLRKAGLTYKKEVSFPDLKDKDFLRFDFGIYKNQKLVGLIEVDGEQHFQSIEHFGGNEEFKRVKKTDRAKNRYCLMKKIPLFRVPFSEIETFTLDKLPQFKVTSQYHNDNIINGRKN